MIHKTCCVGILLLLGIGCGDDAAREGWGSSAKGESEDESYYEMAMVVLTCNGECATVNNVQVKYDDFSYFPEENGTVVIVAGGAFDSKKLSISGGKVLLGGEKEHVVQKTVPSEIWEMSPDVMREQICRKFERYNIVECVFDGADKITNEPCYLPACSPDRMNQCVDREKYPVDFTPWDTLCNDLIEEAKKEAVTKLMSVELCSM